MSEVDLIAKRVRRLAVAAQIKVASFLSGNRRSLFLGNGTDFADLREYVYGDELKYVDWRATAKYQDKIIVKEFEVTRNANVMFVLDSSASMLMGRSGERIIPAVISIASLAHAVLRNKDLFGFASFSEDDTLFLNPKGGKAHEFLIYRKLLDIVPHGGTKIGEGIKHVATNLNKRSILIILSDLHDDLDSMYKGLKIAKGFNHDIIVIQLTDREDYILPKKVGKIKFKHPATNKPVTADFSDPIVSGRYAYEVNRKREELNSFIRKLRGLKIKVIRAFTEDMIEKILLAYFSEKQRGFQ